MNRPDAPLFDNSPANLANPIIVDAQTARRNSRDRNRARTHSLFKSRLLAVCGVFGIGLVGALVAVNTDAVVPISKTGEQLMRLKNVNDKPHFEELSGVKPNQIKIHVHGDDEIQVRSDAVLGDNSILGITKPGLVVTGVEGTGNLYPADLYETIQNGQKRGFWYRIDEIPIFEKIGDEYFPKLDDKGKPVIARDAYIAAHFGDEVKAEDNSDLSGVQ